MFCRLVVLVRLSVPVQVTDWKNSSPKEMTYNVLMGTLNPTHTLTHSLTRSLTLTHSHSVTHSLTHFSDLSRLTNAVVHVAVLFMNLYIKDCGGIFNLNHCSYVFIAYYTAR